MQNYFENNYDPTDEEIRRVFPNYSYGTKESWLENFKNGYILNPKQLATVALNKLSNVNTSFRLKESQRLELQDLKQYGIIHRFTLTEMAGFDAYCNILTPKQMCYVGF